MKALLRPLSVGMLSIAMAATGLLGSSSPALAATAPTITSLSITSPVNQGDKPTVTGTFTDPDLADRHTVTIGWGDGSMDFYTLVVGDRSFALQKQIGYPGVGTNMMVQVTLDDPAGISVTKFLTITVNNVAPSITSFSLSSTDLNAGSSTTATGGFDDPGTAETHTVTVDWGDGTTPITTLNLARRVWAFKTAAHTYSAGGTFTVTATVTDSYGGSAVATATVTVHGGNQAPSVVSFGVTAANEGGSSTLSLTFADADAADTHTVSVAWGDGSSLGPVTLDSTVTTYSTNHIYADTGTYQVGLTLGDSAGHSVTAAASVAATNVAPTVGALTLTPSSVVDQQTLTVTGEFSDPGTADTFTLTVDWGDGKSSTQSLAAGTRSFSATHAYAAAGAVTIKATVTDRDNGSASSSADLVVLPSNHAPADLAVSSTATVEGGTTTLSVSFTDQEALDTHTLAVNWGDTSTESPSLAAGVISTSLTHLYAETGSYTVAVTVTDAGKLSVSGGTTVAVGNVAPSVSSLVLSPSSVTDHQTLTLSGSFTDPGTADTFTVSVDWGDQSPASTQPLAAGARAFTASHAYSAKGTYVVTASVTDRDNGAGSQSLTVVVSKSNTGPSSVAVTPTVNGSTVVVSGGFVDPDVLDTHTVTINWSDGTTTTGLAAGVTSFTGSHAYSTNGTRTLTATVTDPSGASAEKTVQVTVAATTGGTPAALLEEMRTLVSSFGLDRTTERWLLRRIAELKASLAQGNGQICQDLETLARMSSYASHTLTPDQFAALSALAAQLEAAANCTATSFRGSWHETPRTAPIGKPVAPKPPVVRAPETNKSGNDNSQNSQKGKQDNAKQASPQRTGNHQTGDHDSR